MVPVWINADTGVGPAMASGSQVYKGICALLPQAPTNNKMVMPVISVGVNLLYRSNTPVPSAVVYVTVPSFEISQKMAIKKPRSPIRFMIKAFLAALLYSVFLNQ